MSDAGDFTPDPAEIVSTPGADVFVPHTTLTATTSPANFAPATHGTPAEIELSGAVQVS